MHLDSSLKTVSAFTAPEQLRHGRQRVERTYHPIDRGQGGI